MDRNVSVTFVSVPTEEIVGTPTIRATAGAKYPLAVEAEDPTEWTWEPCTDPGGRTWQAGNEK